VASANRPAPGSTRPPPNRSTPPAHPAPPNRGEDFRQNNFDFLRFALALAVIYAHSHLCLHGLADGRRTAAARWAADVGTLALNCFFIISGFLITHSWAKDPRLTQFLRKRVLRIYPGFVAAMLFCAFVVAPLASDGSAPWLSPHRLRNLVFHSAVLHPYAGVGTFTSNPFPGAVNVSMWSIRYEFWCYVAIGLAATAGLLRRPRAVLTLLAAVYALYVAQAVRPWLPDWGAVQVVVGELANWPRFATCFLAGSVFYAFRGRIPRSAALAGVSVIALAAAHALDGGPAAAVPVFGTYLVLYLAYAREIPLQSFGRHGDFSYGTYLYAFPIQQLLVMYLPGRWKVASLFVAASVLALAAGFLSWHLVEKHFLRLKRPGRRRAPAADRHTPGPQPAPIDGDPRGAHADIAVPAASPRGV
jgi:peptidoglycan/LPS O-acetylase OafA/YrhL